MSNMTNKLPGVYLPTRIELDETVHPSLKGSGAYLIFSELEPAEIIALKAEIRMSKTLKESLTATLVVYSNHFVEGKLPDKKGLFDVTKEYVLNARIPTKIVGYVTSVLISGVLPKKVKSVSAN